MGVYVWELGLSLIQIGVGGKKSRAGYEYSLYACTIPAEAVDPSFGSRILTRCNGRVAQIHGDMADIPPTKHPTYTDLSPT